MITMQEKAAALAKIAAIHDGVITPDDVVAEAKNPKHVLHPIFEWDDRIAAHERRLDVARHLIASIEVIIETEDVTISAISYVRDVRKRRGEQGYTSVDALSRRREDAQATIMIELERIVGGVERARLVAGSLGLASYFEEILTQALAARMRIQRRKK
jgi:hypothetical protein